MAIALLLKSPAGLFPLALPGIAWLTLRNISAFKAVTMTFASVGGLVSACTVVLSGPSAQAFYRQYLDQQVRRSVDGTRKAFPDFWRYPTQLLGELALPLLIVLFVARPWRGGSALRRAKPFPFMLAIALSDSFPLFAIPKQRWHYLYPSLPFYALALASALQTLKLAGLEPGRVSRWLPKLALLTVLAGAGLIAHQAFNPGRLPSFHSDLMDQSTRVPARSTLQVCTPAVGQHWLLVAYLQRDLRLSLSYDPQPMMLIDKDCGCTIPSHCRPLTQDPVRFQVAACDVKPAGP